MNHATCYMTSCSCYMNLTQSAVRSEVLHSQFGEGARPYLCMNKWNCPTVRRRMSLTRVFQGKLILINRPGTGPGYENMEPGYILAILRVSSTICLPIICQKC